MNSLLRRSVLPVIAILSLGAVPAARATVPQSVAITSHSDGDSIIVSSPTPTVTLTATATGSGGTTATIASVAFQANGATIGTDTTSPYSVTWTPSTPGAFTITAVATDTTGAPNVLTSSISLTVSSLRLATVTAPAANTTFAQGAQAYVRATASMSDGIISSVEFLLTDGGGTTSLGTATTAPYNRAVTFNVAPGGYTLSARATSSGGAIFTSPGVPITIAPAIGNGPTATITAPTASDVFAAGSSVTIFATATDSDGSITGVTFFADGEQIGTTDTTAPYSVAWTPATVKTYALTALATDNNGNTRLSPVVNVNALSSAPTVSVTTPATGNVGVPQNISATATPTAGTTVTQVQFFANGTSISSPITSPPYNFAWTPQNTGANAITARATDSNGVVATSAPVTVTVGTTSLPVVSITAPQNGATVATGTSVNVTAAASAATGLTISSVTFFADGVQIGSPDTIAPYSTNWVATGAGPHILSATAVDSVNGTSSSQVTVNVTGSTTAPVVTLGIVGSTSIPAGSARAFTVTTTPATGIAQVELLLDGTVIATDMAAPFNFLLLAPSNIGPHQVTARALDITGLSATSAPINIFITGIVGSPPSIGITTPTPNAFLAPNTQTVIAGTASDTDGTITGVLVYANDTLVGATGQATLSGNNWSINWTTPVGAGPTTIVAVATDSSGNSIAAIPVGVNIADTASPAIVLGVSPVVSGQPASTTFPSGAVKNFVATVTPSSGRAVVRVEFFIDGTKVGEDTTAPYTFRYTAPALGEGEVSRAFVLSARATDNAGAARDVQIPLLVVSPIGLPPTVTLLTPTNNSTVTPGVAVSMAATAVANGGTIASVQFYVNGNPAGINGGNAVTTAPYTATFTPPGPGTYVVDAIATDDRGNTTVSNTATFTASFATPTITFLSPNPNSTARATPNVPLTLTAAATVPGGAGSSVLLVEFLLDGVQIGARTTPTNAQLGTYSFGWTPTAAQIGAHVLTARVTDTNSQSATSAPVNVNVATIVGTPPTVTISTTPVPTQGLQTLSTVNFIANAFANGAGSTLTNVEFFLNEVSIGLAAREQTTNLYRLAYDFSRFDFSALTPVDVATPAPAGPRYQLPLYAIARDSNNNQTVSATATLNIYPSTSAPPTVTLQSLLGTQTTITQGQQFLAGIISSDSDGTVSQIQLLANGVVVGTANNPAQGQIITYNANTPGRFNFVAVALDDTGNTVVSTPAIVITVNAISTPVTTITRPSDDSTATTVGAPVFLEGTATNPDTTQLPVVLFIATGSGGARQNIPAQRVGTTNTYRAIWTPTTPDTFTLSTQATVGQVQGTSTANRRVVVTNLQGLAPTLTIAIPGTATTASTVNFTATATDSDGSVTEVEFFLNRNSLGQATRDPQGNTWRLTATIAGTPLGNSEVVALARDSSGNVAASTTSIMSVTAASSIAPTISISLSTNNPAFNRQVQLRANARDTDGTITNVTYFANNTNLGSSNNAGTSYQVNWTPNLSGEFRIWATATDNSGNVRVADPVFVTVRANNPILEDAAFVLQTYQDIANTTNINPFVFDDLVAQLGAGTLTRAQLVADLVDETGFNSPVFTLATYYVLMGQQWPTPANYTTFVTSTRNNGLANTINAILNSNEYVAKYGVVPTQGLLNNPSSAIPAETFILQIWRGAGLPGPTALQNQQFRANNVLTATMGRGYNVIGLQQALAEFITNTNSQNVELFNKARAAAVYYQLTRPPVTVSVEQITAKVAALAEMKDARGALDYNAIADASLKDILYGYRYVTIRRQPSPLIVAPRSGAIFSVEAEGAPPLAYQWLLNGAPIAGATNATLSLTNVDGGRVGSYSVAITSSAATATSLPVTLTLSTAPTKLANISTRGGTTGAGANVLIGGFVVSGANAQQSRQMLIRVVGPTLGAAPFNVPGVLANPRLEVFSGNNQNPVLTNEDWGTQAGGAAQVTAIQQATTRAGAFNLPNNSLDAVVLATLPPGPYTVQAKSPANNPGATGVVLIEVYDVTPGAAAPGKAANVSTRGVVGTGNNILIAGFVVNGTAHRRVLIRGAGPTLANLGVTGVLADPQLTLIDQSSGRTLATNDNWGIGNPDQPIIAAASTAAGAFPFPNNSRDSAIIIMLPPGQYTAQLSGVANGTGVGIVEVYDVDP